MCLSKNKKKMIRTMIYEQGSTIVDVNDVMVEILSRLPLKSLLKFKSVCKLWHHLISDPIFISNYSRRNPHHHVSGLFLQKFLFLRLYSELEFIPFNGQTDIAAPLQPSLSFIQDENGVCILHSCNGLLICSSFRCHENQRKYYISKPTTKQYLALPSPECNNVFGMSMVFDPDHVPHFQVICICDSQVSSHHRQIKIYNSATGSWRLSGKPFFESSDDFIFKRGMYWRGALYWVSRGKFCLRFEVQRELLVKMPMPSIYEERRLIYFGESCGHLYLIQCHPQASIFDVLEKKSTYNSDWFIKYQVDLEAIAEAYPQMVRRDVPVIHRFVFSVLHLVHREEEDEDEDESFMVLHIPGNFILYYFRSNTIMELSNVPSGLMGMDRNLGLKYTWEEVLPYTNTLSYL